MDEYESLHHRQQAKKREQQAREEAAEHEYAKEQAERRAADAERRRRAEASAAREELGYREQQVSNLADDLEEARADVRREKARVTSLVEVAREFMGRIADHLKWHPGEDLNGETLRAWQGLQEVCDAARPRVE